MAPNLRLVTACHCNFLPQGTCFPAEVVDGRGVRSVEPSDVPGSRRSTDVSDQSSASSPPRPTLECGLDPRPSSLAPPPSTPRTETDPPNYAGVHCIPRGGHSAQLETMEANGRLVTLVTRHMLAFDRRLQYCQPPKVDEHTHTPCAYGARITEYMNIISWNRPPILLQCLFPVIHITVGRITSSPILPVMGRMKNEVDSMSDSLESLETKSSMSGSANSLLTQPKPFNLILLSVLFFLLLASIGGLSTSAVEFKQPSTVRGTGVTQSFVLFSSLISPLYLFLHIIVSFGNYQSSRQSLQAPVVSWAVILARISLILWVVTLVLTAITVSHPQSNSVITRSNLALATFGVTCLAILVFTMEMTTKPFELPFTPRKSTVTCLVRSFEDDFKCEPTIGHHCRTMTLDSVSSGGSGRSGRSSRCSRSSSSRKRAVPVPCNRVSTILEEETQSRVGSETPDRPMMPEPCHVPPPGTAWARDWEQLAVETGVHRNNSVSDYGSTVESDDAVDQRWHLRQPPPAIVVTSS
ncbi:hypothetical protein SODALDRAFT_382395 [Sodiomyces alkalinus F11]|uniref:Uncharacterized protein n=1 Tax=Sodiomyces alkalinus (strain CBS 110278 / VKM F-3762 / F11) TaxID=1314773 RepID=A0A3N2PJA2_SODAK|nr:hypothetical protein SODALDRAFT_382395 [Sodiomyces alkalinus F11]ROT34599.1 hypothetical protein SODALDRAFT_382395 [Sodiomyces alkalinus F11]